MASRTAHELRTQWGSAMREVTDIERPEHVEITRTRGKITEKPGVLVNAAWWSAAIERFPVDSDKVQTIASKQVRIDLRRTLNAAAAGIHTKITVFSDVEAIMVPRSWYEKVQQAGQVQETDGGPAAK
jgi:hypothetical protein